MSIKIATFPFSFDPSIDCQILRTKKSENNFEGLNWIELNWIELRLDVCTARVTCVCVDVYVSNPMDLHLHFQIEI